MKTLIVSLSSASLLVLVFVTSLVAQDPSHAPCPANTDGCYAQCMCDVEGRIVIQETEGVDGAIISRVTYTYDDNGYLTMTETDGEDPEGSYAPCDGSVDIRCTYSPPCPPPFSECGEQETCERLYTAEGE